MAIHVDPDNFVDTKRLPVMEIFGPTIQGEGFMIGQKTFFVRFGGCGYRCTWCDSMHAVDPKEIQKHAHRMLGGEIGSALEKLGGKACAEWVTFSGGDPVMHDLLLLSRHLRLERGLKIAVETQGQYWREWLIHANHVTVSPKGPSSGMAEKFNDTALRTYESTIGNRMSLKVVVFTEEDVQWAIDLHKQYRGIPFYLSVGTPPETETHEWTQQELTDHIMCEYDRFIGMVTSMPGAADIRILPQMHVLLWGHKKGV